MSVRSFANACTAEAPERRTMLSVRARGARNINSTVLLITKPRV